MRRERRPGREKTLVYNIIRAIEISNMIGVLE
jgi:hypothetical protein